MFRPRSFIVSFLPAQDYILDVRFSPTLSLLPSLSLSILDSANQRQVQRRTVCVILCQYRSVKRGLLLIALGWLERNEIGAMTLGETGGGAVCLALSLCQLLTFLAGTSRRRADRAHASFPGA